MSYILDALRRADAERERGAVPTLHARHEAGPVEDDEGTRRPWLAIGGGAVALVVAGAVGAWLLTGGEPEPRPSLAAAGPSPVTDLPPPPLPSMPTAAPAETRPGVPADRSPALPRPAATTPTASPVVPTTAPTTAVTLSQAPAPASRVARTQAQGTAGATASMPARRATAASAAVPAAAAEDRARVYAVADLPDAVKRDLPRVAISGGSWSRDKASRMVMVNGQVLHEGDAVAPGLVLESIRLKSAVLAWKGYRYELSY